MQILIVSATALEIAPYRQKHPAAEILITGVGIPGTTYHLTKRLLEKPYDMVIQCGIAGTFNDMKLGSVVFVKEEVFGDIGIEAKGEFTNIFTYGLSDPDLHPFTNGRMVNMHTVFRDKSRSGVNAVTVNKISDNKIWIQQLAKNTAADIQSMEGAAFHYVCLQMRIPFLQLRGISNKVGERDKTKWEMQKAIDNVNHEMDKLIEYLQS